MTATLEELPGDATHWSRAPMARRSGLSKSTVERIWRKSGLKPHLTDGLKLLIDDLTEDADRIFLVVVLDARALALAARSSSTPESSLRA